MQSIRHWLARLDLEQYAAAFERDDVGIDVLRELSESDLAELGVSLGHRKRILAALRTLDAIGTAYQPKHDASPGIAVETVTADGERRQLTVLFCDLVGSTALSGRLDPEDYRNVLARYHQTCIACVRQLQGFVAQIQGDGLLVYFGYPLAHEGEAERAIRAALAIVPAVQQLDAGADQHLDVRIGVASGLVVVSHVLAADRSAVGETPNLAQRLQTLAGPGQIMTGERTRALATGRFDFEDCGLHSLRGIAEPVHAWRVLGFSNASSRFEAATRCGMTPMVGREREIALLVDRWERSRTGEGQVILLGGEPGIGKSRMLHAFRDRMGGRLDAVLQLQCSAYYTNSPFYPFAEYLERVLSFTREDSHTRKLEKIERFFLHNGPRASIRDPSPAAPNPLHCNLLAKLLSIPCEGRYEPLDSTAQEQKNASIALLVDIMVRAAAQHAGAVLFEDVHWADPTTHEVLEALVETTRLLPLLVVISYRPEFVPSWTSRPHITLLPLMRLSRAQGASIVLRVSGKSLPSTLVDEIVDKTDGVPLFLEELTKAVLESSLLKDCGDRYDYCGKLERLAVPGTLRDSLMARLDRLIPVKEIAQIGACLGREFSYELVKAVCPWDREELDEALNRLVASELVFSRGAAEHTTYIFKHALVQDAAYDSLLKSKRQALHAQIADVVEKCFPSKIDSEPELLAHHYTEAGLSAKAIHYWHMAGDLSRQRFALQEAVGSYRRAVQLLATVGSTRETMERQIVIAIAWADLIVPSNDVIAALETAEQHAEILREAHRLAEVLSYAGQLLFYTGRLERAIAKLQRVIGMADHLQHMDRVGSSYRCLGQIYLMGYSRYSDALDSIRHAIPIVQRTGNGFEESCCYGLLGLEYGFQGRFIESFDAFDIALRVARGAQERSIECWVLKWRAFIHSVKGDWAKAAAGAEEGLRLARRIENAWAGDWCIVVKSYALFMTNRDASLIDPPRDALDRLAGHLCISVAYCLLAEMQWLSGNPSDTAISLERAASELPCGTYFSAQVRLSALRAMSAAARPDREWQTVNRDMDEAIVTAQADQRLPDLAICQLRRSQLLRQQGEQREAAACLQRATELFISLDMTGWLAEARTFREVLAA